MDQRFGKQYRLLKTDDFSSVFALRNQRSQSILQVLQSSANGLGHARIGIIVSKKNAKRANKRNYMKRTLREWFRIHKYELAPHDYIVRIRQPFSKKNRKDAVNQLSNLMRASRNG